MHNDQKAKKSLGQHFLTDPNILEKIAGAGNVSEGDLVLEIGPGRGALTRSLLDRGARVIAIEKDEALIPTLHNEFKDHIESEKLTLLEGDVLDLKGALESLLSEHAGIASHYKVVANIPYYITGKILRFLFGLALLPSIVVLLVQEEVARRATVPDGEKESILSLSIKAFGTPHYRGKVKAGSFSPPPKVDSAILSIENISRDYFDSFSEMEFFSVIKCAFSQKRKTLLNTLFSDDKETGRALLERVGLSSTTRPEELMLEEWKGLIVRLPISNENR
jgi:16S rRNA (adenine1518-N6/adenine1519-N6)-dimethyltransferase